MSESRACTERYIIYRIINRHNPCYHKKEPPDHYDPEALEAVRTGLEPATPCVTGMYSNQAELPHLNVFGRKYLSQTQCKCNTFFLTCKQIFHFLKIEKLTLP